jgi:hypothetical protein
MIIGARAIRPMVWRIALTGIGLSFAAMGAYVAIDFSTDPGSVVIGVAVALIGLYFAIKGAVIGAVRTPDGFTVRQIGKSMAVITPSVVEAMTSSTWWGATTVVPLVRPGDGSEPYEVGVLAMYAWSQRGRARADRVSATLASWLPSSRDV